MNFWKRSLEADGFITEIAPLNPPATDAELRWWKTQRRAHQRKVFLRAGLPLIVVGFMTMLVANPAKLLTLKGLVIGSLFFVIAFVASKVQMRQQERQLRDNDVRWKRIRDDLNAPDTTR